METDNTVSIWIGNFKNLTELENYIDLTYDDEGEIVVSDFFNDFKIDINDVVLIYNYAYDGSVKSSDYLNFITSVDYR